jgi:hypothetical protein
VKGNLSRHFSACRYVSILSWMLAFAILGLFAASQASAQDTGYISGTVSDKSGAAIADATVVISNVSGATTQTTTTNTDGAYVVAGLPGGSYNITVTATGFQKYTANGVVLNVGSKIRVDVPLTVGSVTEEVVVTGESVAQVETTSAALGTTVSGKQIQQLELNGRNFTQLVNLTPGVVNQTGQDEGTVGINGNVQYSINGGRTEYNNWELDGGDNMDNGSNATLNVYPNVEAIAEFKVLTSNYGAQYGRNGSGTIEVETKSGGKTFHGSAFEYLRNDIFNARSWEQGADPTEPKAPYKKHDFGYTVGGPVFIPHHYNSDRNKTFFFWSQEWRREKNPSTVLQNVPSDAERAGDFSDICPGTDCPNVANPAAVPITPVGSALLSLIPTANTTNGLNQDNGAPLPAFTNTISLPTVWREELVRVDHNITDNYRVTFRYIHDSWSQITNQPLWGVGGSSFQNINTNFVGPGTSFVARLTANITPTLLNEFVASYTADHIDLTAINNPALPGTFPMGSLFANGFGGKLPSIAVNTNAVYGGGFSQDTGYFPWTNANPVYTYRDNLTKIFGKHTFIFGAYFVAAQKNEENTTNVQGILTFDPSSPVSTGNAFADLLMGNVANYSQGNQLLKYYNRYKIFEPYFQDDWRVTKKLTLNLGLRVSLFGTYRERYQSAFSFSQGAFSAGSEPGIFNDPTNPGNPLNGSLTGGNPFNGIVQCGGKGGTGSIPGPIQTQFPNATVGANNNPGCLQGHLFNPAPRIGFAWDPKGDGKMAIRGGYGIFYEHTNGNEGNSESLEGSAPLVLTSQQFNVAGYGNIGGGGGVLFPLSFTQIPTKAIWPYVQQWNLNVQKELPGHVIASVAYVGSKGTHLTLQNNANQLVPVSAANNPFAAGTPITDADCGNFVQNAFGVPVSATLGNGTAVPGAAVPNLWVACGNNPDPLRQAFPGASNITQLEDQANSIYHSLQVSAQRTVGALTLSFSYTYSHSIDDSSDRFDNAFVNAFDVASNRAASNFDQRHNAAISYVYALPFAKAPGLKHTLLGGWQVSGITVAQSGTPFSVTNGTNFGDSAGVGNGVGTGSRPDLVGDPGTGSYTNTGAGERGPLYYNPGAYAIPTGLTFGTVGRNTLYMPGRLNFDFGTFKRFEINERSGFEFKWETFNLFNHTQYNGINSALDTSDPGANTTNSGFLHLNAAHLPRIMQLGLRFYF